MKKLLITTDNFLPRMDGISVFLSKIIPRLSKKFDITVVCPNYGDLPKMKAKIVQIPLSKMKFGDYQLAKYMPGKIRKLVKQADIIYNQTMGPIGIASINASKKYGKPLVSYIFSIDWELFAYSVNRFKRAIYHIIRWFELKMYQKVDLLILPDNNVKKKFRSVDVMKKLIPLRIDVNSFRPGNTKKKLGYKNKFIIGYTGRLAREKDIPTLCKAIKMLANKYEKIKLLIIGKGIDLPGCRHECIKFLGEKKDVEKYLQAMDVYVLPSLTETCSLSTMEAMSCGVPVITTRVGRLKEYIKNGINGIFFEKRNSQDLARKIEKMMRAPKLRQKIGRNARKTALKEFDIKLSIEEIETSLKSLC